MEISRILFLPTEIFGCIISYVEPKDLLNLSVTCKSLYSNPFNGINTLDFNTWRRVSADSLLKLIEKCPNLKELHLGNAVKIRRDDFHKLQKHRTYKSLT